MKDYILAGEKPGTVTSIASSGIYLVERWDGAFQAFSFEDVERDVRALMDKLSLGFQRPEGAYAGTIRLWEFVQVLWREYLKQRKFGEAWYDPRTPEEVRTALDNCLQGHTVIRIWFGDPDTGLVAPKNDWWVGMIGLGGPAFEPILARVSGGGGPLIPTHLIVRIRDEASGEDLYRHGKFHMPEMRIENAPSGFVFRSDYPVHVMVANARESRVFDKMGEFRTYAGACAFVAWHHGENFDGDGKG